MTERPSLRVVDPSEEPNPDHSDPIAAIQAKLRRYPQARAESANDRVAVYPLDAAGFTVTFQILPKGYLVCCEGWHEHFDSQEDAIECFAFALSSEARLQVTARGGFPYRWQLQALRDGRWVGVTETGLLFFPFWRRAKVFYLQNRLLTAA